VAPRRVSLGRHGEAEKGQWWRCLLCFGAEGGRRGRVGQKAEQADGAAGLRWAGKANWVERSDNPARLLGRRGQNPNRKSFENKNWIFEFTKALEICTR
jgi:hypothetical protein